MKLRATILSAACAALVAAAPAGAAAPKRLPDGATIAGVPVAGLGPVGAQRALEQAFAQSWERPITVRVGSRDQTLSTRRAGQTINYKRMVEQAFALAARGRAVDVRLDRDFDSRALERAASALGKPFYRKPRNARVRFGVRKVIRIRARHGRGLDTRALRHALAVELRRPTELRIVRGRTRLVQPRIETRDLRRVYSTYISVDRGSHTLRLFKRLRVVRRYTIAVGMAGHDTPSGLRHVLWKQLNPAWHVPNSPWAGSLAGQTIPAGDPGNPLKYAFISLGDGIGIHGTSEDWSIGTSASHGCLRMHVSDVKALYPRVPVGTPVYIR